MPIIPPNNTTGLYGVDTTVSINNNIYGNNMVLTGDASIAGNLSVGGTITGNVVLTPPGSDGQVLYNNSGVLAGAAGLTYDDSNAIVGANTVASIGAVDLLLKTNGTATSEGNIRITDGANGNIAINPNGSGSVNMDTAALNFTRSTGTPEVKIAPYQGSNLVLSTGYNLPFQTHSAIQIDWNSGSGQSANISLTPVPGRAINLDYSNVRVRGQTSGGSRFGGSMFVDDNVFVNSIQGNTAAGNLTVRNSFAGSSVGANILLDAQEVLVGSDNGALGTNGVVRAVRNTALQLTTTNAGAPSVYVGKYVSSSNVWTGNIDMTTSNVGGYAGTGNINMSGNVYIGRAAQGADANALANLMVADSVYATYLHGDGSNITGVVSGAASTRIAIKNTSGSSIAKGTPVYATGTVGASTIIEVAASRADTDSTMPCIGLADATLAINDQGYAISVGTLTGVNTAAFATGDLLYVAATGGLTKSRPTGTNIVQTVGVVGRVNASNGSIETNIWTEYALPNLGNGNIWIGNAAAYPTETTLATYTGNIGAGNITVGSTGVPGTVTIVSGNTVNMGRLVATYISAESDLGEVNFIKPSSGLSPADGNIVAGNITSLGQLSVGGNVIVVNRVVGAALEAYAANVSQNFIVSTSTGVPVTTTTGTISAAGNITGNYFIGNGSALTGITVTSTPAGSNTQLQFNDAGVTGASANLTFDKVTNLLSSAGNITGANLNATTNATTGNIIISLANNNIKNINAWDPSVSPNPGRITLGNGYDGDYSATRDPLVATRGAVFSVMTKQNIGNADVNQSLRGFNSQLWADMAGATLTNNARRMQGLGGALAIGNGTMTLTSAPFYPAVAGGGSGLQVGNITLGTSNFFQGTTTNISHGVAGLNNVLVGGNATVGNVASQLNQIQFFTNNTGNVRSGIGNFLNFTGGQSGQPVPGNVYGVYMPGTTANHGLTNSNFWRIADNYYFLRNEDDVAQNRMGSLRAYHEYNGVSATTSGSLTIDKANGQVQQVNLTGNVSSLAFSNFVSSASDSVTTDEQCDTVTIIFNQGATGGYGVTFPTGSTYKYAGGVTALQSTAANSVSLVSVSAVRISSTTTYLITISPGFV